MAALTAIRNTVQKSGEACIPRMLYLGMTDNVKAYIGGIAVIDANGWVKPGVTETGDKCVGVFANDPMSVALQFYDNTITGHVAGFVSAWVMTGVFYFNNAAADLVVQADVGGPCYITDDNTVNHTGTGKSLAGLVLGVNGANPTQGPPNQVQVLMSPYTTPLS